MQSAKPEPHGDSSPVPSAEIVPAKSGFRLAHLMVIVAMTALGIVGIRACDSQTREMGMVRGDNIALWFFFASPLLLSYTVALAIARLLPPRPRLQECFRQPGHLANLMTSLILSYHGISMFLFNRDHIKNVDSYIYYFFDFHYYWPTVFDTGRGVIVAWSTLAVAGCWRPEPGWIDRSGRVLGLVFISGFLIQQARWLLWH